MQDFPMKKIMVFDQRFVVYLAGGLLSAIIDVGIFQAILVLYGNIVVATSAGFFISLLFNYLFHARFTFETKAHSASFGKYLVIVCLNYLIALGFVSLAFTLFDNALAGKIASLPVIAVGGYLFGKYWIFK